MALCDPCLCFNVARHMNKRLWNKPMNAYELQNTENES